MRKHPTASYRAAAREGGIRTLPDRLDVADREPKVLRSNLVTRISVYLRAVISTLLILALLPISSAAAICDLSCRKAVMPEMVTTSEGPPHAAHRASSGSHHHDSSRTTEHLRSETDARDAADPHQISDSHGCCDENLLTLSSPCATSLQESQVRTTSPQFDSKSATAQAQAPAPVLSIKKANRVFDAKTLRHDTAFHSLTLRI